MNQLILHDCLEHCLPNTERESDQFNLQLPYGTLDVSYFNTGHHITCSLFQGMFTEDVIFKAVEPREYGFLCFNQGHSLTLKSTYSHEEHSMHIGSKSFINGIMREGQVHHTFSAHRWYCCTAITLEKALYDSLYTKETPPMYMQTLSSPEQILILQHIQNHFLLQGSLKNLFLESKILELTHLSLHTMNQPTFSIYLNEQDKQALQKAKQIIFKERSNPPSIKELSRRCAINEFKLKKGFKELFGNTIYGMLQSYRLEEAKELLVHNDISVYEAARLVGYTSLNHFRKIFKERYGFLPIQARSVFRSHPKE